MAHDVTVFERESDSTTSPTGLQALDPEYRRQAYTRLAWTAMLYAAGYSIAFGTDWALGSMKWTGAEPRPEDIALGFGAVAVAVGVATAARRQWIPITYLSSFAILFLIVGAFGINLGFLGWEHRLTPGSLHLGVPWVCVWILAFPGTVPSPPRRTLIGALGAALSGPLVMIYSVIVNGLGDDWTAREAASFIASRQVPAFVSAGISQGIAILVYRLSRQATEARRLGSYQLESRLGTGGMGEVWRARHRLLVRPAAIKLIRAEALGASESERRTVVRRFEREAQATALLKSPHTIVLYDFGVTDDGTFYYVMELLDGLDLKTLVERNGPIPQERAIHLLRQVCHSLAEAHDAGLVHRDVKPANIHVGQRGADHDFVKVLDFGLAADSRPNVGDDQLTGQGKVSGTPAFMPPEMIQGRELDARADLYGVGCVAYWLLTGMLVFEGASSIDVLLKHVQTPPPRPSSVSELSIHPDLDDIVVRCLAKEPGDRPADARQLARELAACAAFLDPWTSEMAAAWWSKRRATPPSRSR